MTRHFLLLVLLFLSVGAAIAQKTDEPQNTVALESLNRGLSEFPQVARRYLDTPQSTLAYFSRLSSEKRYAEAALALDLSHLERNQQSKRGKELSAKLYQIMDRHVGFSFSSLPDVGDGRESPSATSRKSQQIQERKNFLLGTLAVPHNQFEIRLKRYNLGEGDYVWLFAPSTVELVEDAYQTYGPSEFENSLPESLKVHFMGRTPLWAWLLFFACLATCAVTFKLIAEALTGMFEHKLLKEMKLSLIVSLTCWTTHLLLFNWTPLPEWLSVLLLITGCFALIWVGTTAITFYSQRIVKGDLDTVKELDDDENDRQKRQLTYLSVGRRVLSFIAVLFATGTVVTSFPAWRATGTSLLASAGVLSILLGIAAQPVLGNIIAGIQILVSRPIRVGDAIEFEGIWAYVEEITHMYVLCCTWDEKRLIIPLRHFVSNPFQNYSLRDPLCIRTVEMDLDFGTDVQAFREEFLSYAKGHRLSSDRYEPKVQVLSCNRETVTVRALMASEDANSAWELHCDAREHMLNYIVEEQQQNLPRERVVSVGDPKVDSQDD